MTEAELQEAVIDIARIYRWRVSHFRPVRVQRPDGSVYHETPVQADGKGFPDLCLVRPPRLMFVELKSDKGKLSPEQQLWIRDLNCCADEVEVYVWNPVDLRDGTVQQLLR